MQFTLNVLLFALGFSIATLVCLRPTKAKDGLSQIVGRVQFLLDALKPSKHSSSASWLAHDKQPQQCSFMLTKSQIEQDFPAETWEREAYEEIKRKLLAREPGMKTFPCVYATKGYRSDDHRYVFLHSDDPSEPRNVRRIAEAMRVYLPQSTSIGPNTSLIFICPVSNAPKEVQDYNNSFWEMLRGLRISDTEAWPSNIPQDTNDSHWAFCFNGTPLFPVALTPAHSRRQSRFAPNFVITIQPKWVFDNLLGNQQKRDAVTKKVRGLLQEYDTIPISPDLTAYGAPGTSETRQLCLMDDNVTSTCPYDDFDAQ